MTKCTLPLIQVSEYKTATISALRRDTPSKSGRNRYMPYPAKNICPAFHAKESSHRGSTPASSTAGCQGGCWPTKLGTPPAWKGYQLKGP